MASSNDFKGLGLKALTGLDSGLVGGDRLAFFGDSLTQQGSAPNGYVWLIEQSVANHHPDLSITFIKSGVGGDKVPDLEARLKEDILDQRPTLVFICIGVNDVWHSQRDEGTPIARYEAGLRNIIKQLHDLGVFVVLATPAVIGEKTNGSNPLDAMLEPFVAVSRRIAAETGATLCDLRRAFLEHLRRANREQHEQGILTEDGVHLTPAGNRLLAEQAAESIAAALADR